jgi:hypothetical protein
MELLERSLIELVFRGIPLSHLLEKHAEFQSIDSRQLGLFLSRHRLQVKKRLCDQFAGCLGYFEEKGFKLDDVVSQFILSLEFGRVRENLTPETHLTDARFELAFLQFGIQLVPESSEFEELFLTELSM